MTWPLFLDTVVILLVACFLPGRVISLWNWMAGAFRDILEGLGGGLAALLRPSRDVSPRVRPWLLCLRVREVPGALLCLALGGRHRKVLIEILRARAYARRHPPRLRHPGRNLEAAHGTCLSGSLARPEPQRPYPPHFAGTRCTVTGWLLGEEIGSCMESSSPSRPGDLPPGVHQEAVHRPGRPGTWHWAAGMSGRCLCSRCRTRAQPLRAYPVASPERLEVAQAVSARGAVSMKSFEESMERLTGQICSFYSVPGITFAPPDVGWTTGHEDRRHGFPSWAREWPGDQDA